MYLQKCFVGFTVEMAVLLSITIFRRISFRSLKKFLSLFLKKIRCSTVCIRLLFTSIEKSLLKEARQHHRSLNPGQMYKPLRSSVDQNDLGAFARS